MKTRNITPHTDSSLPETIFSERVDTEYDISTTSLLGLALVTLSDDRGREFQGVTLNQAFRRAERSQDPTDPIHHPPFPNPMEVPLP